jgi:hypothetical protein
MVEPPPCWTDAFAERHPEKGTLEVVLDGALQFPSIASAFGAWSSSIPALFNRTSP